jgi:hypothetical protein
MDTTKVIGQTRKTKNTCSILLGSHHAKKVHLSGLDAVALARILKYLKMPYGNYGHEPPGVTTVQVGNT